MSYVLLISSLTKKKKNSFIIQLEVLAAAFESLGITPLIYGKAPRVPPPHKDDLSSLSYSILLPLLDRYRPRCTIILGYPDQIELLREPCPLKGEAFSGGPVFLWAQSSKTLSLPARKEILPVALTPRTARFIRSGGWPLPVAVIPHCVDTQVYKPLTPEEIRETRLQFQLPLATPLIGSIGANTFRKRFDLLIKAAAELSRRQTNFHLYIKTDRLRASFGFDLPELITAADLEDRVTLFPGVMETGQMARLTGCMDLYLHTAEWEGFGLPVLEAMAAGVPAAVPPIQGPGELLPYSDLRLPTDYISREGDTRLVHIDPVKTAEIISNTLTNRPLLQSLRRQGITAACTCYSSEKIAQSWLSLSEYASI